jgi:hypothetical protein
LRRSILVLITVASLALVLGCGSSSVGPTGSTCPKTSTLSYGNFGKAFMDSYCVGCHSKVASQSGIKADLAGIDDRAASGPNGANTSMPKSGASPSDAERVRLGEWLACGAP